MIYEKSAGCIIFREAQAEQCSAGHKGKRLYLLLYKKAQGIYKESWGFPKGWVEKNEELIDTAKRETFEEAGITDLQFFPGFREKVHFMYKREGEFVSKDVYYFLAKTTQTKAKISKEHESYAWLTYEDALKKLKKEDKKVLEKAENYLAKEISNNLNKFL